MDIARAVDDASAADLAAFRAEAKRLLHGLKDEGATGDARAEPRGPAAPVTTQEELRTPRRRRHCRTPSPEHSKSCSENGRTFLCPRCKWIRRREEWTKLCCIRENVDRTLPWSLGCPPCAAAAEKGVLSKSIWSRFEYIGAKGGTLNLNDLLRHCNLAKTQTQGTHGEPPKHPRDKHHDVALHAMGEVAPQGPVITESPFAPPGLLGRVPTAAQTSLALEVIWRMEGLVHYETRGDTERARGADIPWTRRSRHVARQIALAAEEVLYEPERQCFRDASLQEIAIGQDTAAQGIHMVKYKRLMKDTWETDSKLLQAFRPDKGTALGLVGALCYARDAFATEAGSVLPDFVVVREFTKVLRNLCADGEAAEQLAIRLSTVADFAPNADFESRCRFHAGDGVVTRTLKQSPAAQRCIDLFVTGKSSEDRRKGDGQGFARFLRNSRRFKNDRTSRHLRDLENDAVAFGKAAFDCGWNGQNLGFSPIRIVTMADPLRRFLLSLFLNLEVLLEEEADPDGQRDFAKAILDYCTYDNVLFAGGLSEWLSTTQTWVHMFDNKRDCTVLSRVRTINNWYLGELDFMFSGAKPFILQQSFKHSVVHHLLTGMRRMGGLQLASHRRKQFLSIPTTWQEAVSPLGEMRNIIKITKNEVAAHFPCEDLSEAMAPFDLEGWDGSDSMLADVFKPLAILRKADPHETAAQFLRARHTAKMHMAAFGVNNPDKYWSATLAAMKAESSLPDLTKIARPTLTQFTSTSELEQDFSIWDISRGGGRRNVEEDILNAELKLRLDGPAPHTHLNRSMEGKSFPSKFVLQVQAKYFKMFGGVDMSKADETRGSRVVAVIDRRKGAPAPITSAPNVKDSETKWLRARKEELDHARSTPCPDPEMLVKLPSDSSHTIADVLDGEAEALWNPDRSKRFDAATTKGLKRAAQQVSDRIPDNAERTKRLHDEKQKQGARTEARRSATIGSIGENVHRGRYVPTSTFVFVFMERKLAEANDGERVKQLQQVSGKDSVVSSTVGRACREAVTHCFVESLEKASQCGRVSSAAYLARFVGAFYVDQFWLDASVVAGRFVEAPKMFTAKMGQRMQFFSTPNLSRSRRR